MNTTTVRTRFVLVLAPLVLPVLAATSSALACVVGTGTSASCTEAALNACLPGGGSFDSSVNFNCGGAATITLTSGKGISADTSIDGGSLITISGYGFGVDTGVTFTVENLTMANCPAGAIGNGGTLTVTNCTFLANSADYGDGGGAIFNSNEDGTVVATLTVTNSTFSGNSGLSGGAILSIGGTLTVTNCTFLANSADGDGGGAIFNSNTVLEDGTVVVATLTVTNSTFSGNSASSSGLGGFGGAIRNGGTLTVTDSVFCGNSAPAAGLSTTPAAR